MAMRRARTGTRSQPSTIRCIVCHDRLVGGVVRRLAPDAVRSRRLCQICRIRQSGTRFTHTSPENAGHQIGLSVPPPLHPLFFHRPYLGAMPKLEAKPVPLAHGARLASCLARRPNCCMKRVSPTSPSPQPATPGVWIVLSLSIHVLRPYSLPLPQPAADDPRQRSSFLRLYLSTCTLTH